MKKEETTKTTKTTEATKAAGGLTFWESCQEFFKYDINAGEFELLQLKEDGSNYGALFRCKWEDEQGGKHSERFHVWQKPGQNFAYVTLWDEITGESFHNLENINRKG